MFRDLLTEKFNVLPPTITSPLTSSVVEVNVNIPVPLIRSQCGFRVF
jgi:hypothetical protein